MFSQKKPYSAVTVTIENLTSEQYEEDDMSGIPDLVEVIKLQATGPTEAARAIRKKLKYSNVHRQIRALVILDGLIQNAGPRFQSTFADEMLLERLRVCGTSDLSDPLVREKCKVLFRSWAAEYKNTPGLSQIAHLYKELPRRKQVITQEKSKVLRETEQNPFEVEDDNEEANSPPSHTRNSSTVSATGQPGSSSSPSSFFGPSSSKKSKKEKEKKSKGKRKPFNLEAEKETMKSCIAESSVAAINLLNALRLINREQEQISENQAAVQQFEACKLLRRKILRYIHNVNSEHWLGALLHANDELVTALMTFEQLDRSIESDSDSDDEMAHQAHLYRLATEKNKGGDAAQQLAGLNLGSSSPVQPPRPAQSPPPEEPEEEEEEEEEDDDENNPFADHNAVSTPAFEKPEPRWKVV